MPEAMLHPDVQRRLDLPFDRATLLKAGPVDATAFDAIQIGLADICAQAVLHGQHEVVATLLPVLALADEPTVGAVA
jgi:hypothetical protein